MHNEATKDLRKAVRDIRDEIRDNLEDYITNSNITEYHKCARSTSLVASSAVLGALARAHFMEHSPTTDHTLLQNTTARTMLNVLRFRSFRNPSKKQKKGEFAGDISSFRHNQKVLPLIS